MITGPNYEPTSIMVGSIYGLALIMAGINYGPALIMAGSINGLFMKMAGHNKTAKVLVLMPLSDDLLKLRDLEFLIQDL